MRTINAQYSGDARRTCAGEYVFFLEKADPDGPDYYQEKSCRLNCKEDWSTGHILVWAHDVCTVALDDGRVEFVETAAMWPEDRDLRRNQAYEDFCRATMLNAEYIYVRELLDNSVATITLASLSGERIKWWLEYWFNRRKT